MTETPMHHGPAVFELLTNPKLLDTVEELVGPEIYSNPVQHVRIKPQQKNIAVKSAAKQPCIAGDLAPKSNDSS